MTSDKTISKINFYLLRCDFVLAGYFFGSKATGNNHPNSDLDIALFIDSKVNSYEQFLEISRDLTSILKKEGIPGEIDIQPVFTDSRKMSPTNSSLLFNFEVIKSNRLFYQKSPKKTAFLELNILKKYRDFQRLNKIRLNYFTGSMSQNSYGYLKH